MLEYNQQQQHARQMHQIKQPTQIDAILFIVLFNLNFDVVVVVVVVVLFISLSFLLVWYYFESNEENE